MIETNYKCDICGNEEPQEKAKGWLIAYVTEENIAFGKTISDAPGAKHLCGQVCSHKLLDGFMSSPQQTAEAA